MLCERFSGALPVRTVRWIHVAQSYQYQKCKQMRFLFNRTLYLFTSQTKKNTTLWFTLQRKQINSVFSHDNGTCWAHGVKGPHDSMLYAVFILVSCR